MPSVPTQGEVFAKLTNHLREAQSCAAQLSHLAGLQSNHPHDQALARGWLMISEQMKAYIRRITNIAAKGFQ